MTMDCILYHSNDPLNSVIQNTRMWLDVQMYKI